MAGVVHIPWYATGFRHDRLAAALAGIAPVAAALRRALLPVHRFRDDRYKFLQIAEFENKRDFDRYWHGPEFTDFRVLGSSWYQVPVALQLGRPRDRGHARARGVGPRGQRRRRRPATADVGASGDPRLALGRALDVHPHAGQRLADEP